MHDIIYKAIYNGIYTMLSFDTDFSRLPNDAQTEVVNEMIQVVKNWKNSPREMRLCETSRLGLRPNQVYIFTVDESCAGCVEAASYYRD